MLTFYPPINPYKTHQLKVDDLHTLYVEESGNPDGVPVLFIHGGPGGGCDPDNRRFFDPAHYRIILFDQRGCGQSTPHGELENNTTQHLVSDIEAIRDLCNVDKWMLFGGSWGTTLALVYAQMYPRHVIAMILRGIFLCRKEDISWFYQEGASRIFPEYWEEFASQIPKAKRNNLLDAYHAILTGDDDVARMSAAKAWSKWEAVCSTLDPCPQIEKKFTHPKTALSLARIESHYFKNEIFLEENAILKNASRIKDIPGIIVHGRYDVVCPIDNAYALKKVWKQVKLKIIRDAGHAATEAGITDALIHATKEFAR